MSDPLAGWRLQEPPYYRAVGDEVALFESAAAHRMPVLLKGPTGCGKTRFIEHMAWRLGRPLITVACNEDMSAGDLVGRWLLDAEGTRWQDGPLTLAARHGALCYLDEVVETRQDTTVVVHPLTDSRRMLPLDRKGEVVRAHRNFLLVASYNPGYQAHGKELKPSTRQRFAALEFDYPDPAAEAEIVIHETGLAAGMAGRLVQIAAATRALRAQGLEEGASTRMLIHAGLLMRQGVEPRAACGMTLVGGLTDAPETAEALAQIVDAHLA